MLSGHQEFQGKTIVTSLMIFNFESRSGVGTTWSFRPYTGSLETIYSEDTLIPWVQTGTIMVFYVVEILELMF